MEESMTALLTVRQFIRRYFAQGSRPPASTVIKWIEKGTCERNRLRAQRFDGKYYVAICDAESFMRASQVATAQEKFKINAPTHEASMAKLRALGFNI